MAFLCPVRLKKDKKKGQNKAPLPVGRITGSASLDTLAQIQEAKQSRSKLRMIIVQDFEPCVSDEIKVSQGEHVQVLYQENDWLYILTADDREGFVPYSYCLPLERSVDDFVKLERNNNDRQVACAERLDNRRSETLDRNDKMPSKSVPDIAWNCEFATRGSRLQGSQLNRSTRSDSGAQMVQSRRASLREGSRRSAHSFSVHYQDDECKTRSRSLDRNQSATSVVQHSKPSSLTPHSGKSYGFRGSTNTNGSFTDTDHSHHIYVNSDIVDARWPRQRHRSDKPDILPASDESTGCQVSTTSRYSGSDWRNLSTRSAPASWSNRQSSKRLSQKSENAASHSKQGSEAISYTTAKVTCDLFRSSSQPNISLFSKSDKGNYIVMYDFEKQDEDDLSVRRGDSVTVLNTDDPDWFWVINKWNEEGFVPSSYICPAEELLVNQNGGNHRQTSTSAISHSRSISLPVNTKSRSQKNATQHGLDLDLSHSTKLVCLYSYIAETEEHLSISRGDWLYADYNNQPNEDWLWVYSPKEQKSGYVPRFYVKAPNFGYQGPSTVNDHSVSNVRAVRRTRDPFISP